jgi:hypothetical protein
VVNHRLGRRRFPPRSRGRSLLGGRGGNRAVLARRGRGHSDANRSSGAVRRVLAATPGLGVSQDEALSAGDLDGDGRADLLLGTRWLRNAGPVWQPQAIAPEPKPDRNRLADIDGDGRLDAVVGVEAISVPGDVAWYEPPASVGEPWITHPVATVIGPMSLDVGDLDGDGDLDVVVGEHNLVDPASAKLYALENVDSHGLRWVSHVVGIGDEHHDGAVLADIDDDGDLDVLSIGWSHNRVPLYENQIIN